MARGRDSGHTREYICDGISQYYRYIIRNLRAVHGELLSKGVEKGFLQGGGRRILPAQITPPVKG